ncbi:MAG: hypothetical protein RL090_640 [Bacteroidota bacterium]
MKITIYILLLLCFSVEALAQETKQGTTPSQQNTVDPLAGLRKAGPGDIDPGTPLMLNPDVTPIYLEDKTLLSSEDFMKYMMTNEYMPEPYVDDSKNVKAFVLRKSTEEEKAMMRQMMQGGMQGGPMPNENIGRAATAFNVTDMNGKSYSNENLKGKVTVLNFWFIECKPCVMEMPDLNKLVQKYEGKDVVFLGIATNKEPQLKEFLSKTKFQYNIVANGKNTSNAFGVEAYPTHIIIDQNSNVAHIALGAGPDIVEVLDEKIMGLLNP